MANLLAGDIGGTTTRLGLFEKTSRRPRSLLIRTFRTLEVPDLEAIVRAFLADGSDERRPIEAACFGVAGPVAGDVAELTNVPWRVDARSVARSIRLARVSLLNDLEALAYALPVLEDHEVHVLQEGRPASGGNVSVIAAGTGLGEAFLHRVDGRFVAQASEAGHADFAARTDREIFLLRHLTERYGRAGVEHVLSGPGLVNIHRASHHGPCDAAVDLDSPEAPAAISEAALDHRCAGCLETLELFVEAYGAEAGNLALRTMSSGGVFIGGGIAPKILAALATGEFIRAFRAKAPFEWMLDAIPVKVIRNSEAGLLGAATFCSDR